MTEEQKAFLKLLTGFDTSWERFNITYQIVFAFCKKYPENDFTKELFGELFDGDGKNIYNEAWEVMHKFAIKSAMKKADILGVELDDTKMKRLKELHQEIKTLIVS